MINPASFGIIRAGTANDSTRVNNNPDKILVPQFPIYRAKPSGPKLYTPTIGGLLRDTTQGQGGGIRPQMPLEMQFALGKKLPKEQADFLNKSFRHGSSEVVDPDLAEIDATIDVLMEEGFMEGITELNEDIKQLKEDIKEAREEGNDEAVKQLNEEVKSKKRPRL